MSAVRTGIAVVALPLSIVSVLIATSSFYSHDEVRHLLFPVLSACALLFILGVYLILRAVVRMRRYDLVLRELKAKNSAMAHLID